MFRVSLGWGRSVSCSIMSNTLRPCRAPLSVGFSRQEYWSGLPSPGGLPDPGIEPESPALQTDSLMSDAPGKPKNTRVSSHCLQRGAQYIFFSLLNILLLFYSMVSPWIFYFIVFSYDSQFLFYFSLWWTLWESVLENLPCSFYASESIPIESWVSCRNLNILRKRPDNKFF